jgi:hypothetical protein
MDGVALLPIAWPWMELGGKNLSGKAFRFGIFWNRIHDGLAWLCL